jgi:hypothetical protein
MERVVVSILALVAAATTAISLGIIANNGLGIPLTEIRLNALAMGTLLPERGVNDLAVACRCSGF